MSCAKLSVLKVTTRGQTSVSGAFEGHMLHTVSFLALLFFSWKFENFGILNRSER